MCYQLNAHPRSRLKATGYQFAIKRDTTQYNINKTNTTTNKQRKQTFCWFLVFHVVKRTQQYLLEDKYLPSNKENNIIAISCV